MDNIVRQCKRQNDAGRIESPAAADKNRDDDLGSYYYDDSTNYEVYSDDDEIEDLSSAQDEAEESTS